MSRQAAFQYLHKHKGLAFLIEFYDVWIPVVGLIILTAAGTWLTRQCPRVMRYLCAK